MQFRTSYFAAISFGAVLGLASAAALPAAAAPNWGGVTSSNTPTTTTQSPNWGAPAGTKPANNTQINPNNYNNLRAQLGCTINAQQTQMIVTNVSLIPTSRGMSEITLCNMHQPGMPPLATPCGGLGQFPIPALARGGNTSIALQFGYKSDTTPSCQAGALQTY